MAGNEIREKVGCVVIKNKKSPREKATRKRCFLQPQSNLSRESDKESDKS